MCDNAFKVKQSRDRVYDDRYRLQPADFDYDWQSYWEWRGGEPDFDKIEAAEENAILEYEERARLREKIS